MEATAVAVVDRPIEAVWGYVSAVENMAHWVEGVSDVRRTDHELDVGSRFSSAYTCRGTTFDVGYEVTAYDPHHRRDLTSTAGPFPFSGSIRLDSDGDGTEVSNTIDAGSDGLATSVIFAVFGPLVRRLMHRQLAGELDHLSRLLDEDGEPHATPPVSHHEGRSAGTGSAASGLTPSTTNAEA